MPEPTLNLTFADFQSAVGFNLGWGRGPWNTRHQQELDIVVPKGLRLAYFPPPLQPGGESYKWTFLRPTRTFSITSGTRSLELPADFGGFEGDVTLSDSTENASFFPVRVHGEPAIREAFARTPDATGRPRMVAEEWLRGTSADRSQRANLLVYPQADADYTLRVPYYVLPDALTTTHPYAYGGAAHADLFLQACLAAAEVSIDDIRPGEGPQWQLFMIRLATSISLDQRRKPRTLGYNGDSSDDAGGVYRRWRDNSAVVTFDGVTP